MEDVISILKAATFPKQHQIIDDNSLSKSIFNSNNSNNSILDINYILDSESSSSSQNQTKRNEY